ncbi:MAG TPA: hypothetical protein VGD67_09905 [Pseudonocardiaceae bacterium]
MSDTTKPRQVRIPEDIWAAYERVCSRRGLTRAEAINAAIRREIRRHGDDDDRAAIARADAELAERRARKGGRPPAGER